MDVAYVTDRLTVRNWRPEDADRVFDIYSRMEVARWLGARPRPMESLEEARGLVGRWAELNDADPDTGRWAVQRTDNAVVVGTVLLARLPAGDGELEVGWHLHPDSWRRGYATEAGRGALSWAFDRGAEEVYAVVRPTHVASLAVCRRLGMAELGGTDRYYDTRLELFRATPER